MNSKVWVARTALVVATVAAGCGYSDELDDELGQTEQALYGAPIYGGTPPAGTTEIMNAVHRAAALAVSSPVFASCVDESMRKGRAFDSSKVFGPYVGCAANRPDPFEDASIDVKIARAIAASRSAFRARFSFDPTNAGAIAAAPLNVYGSNSERFTWYSWTPDHVTSLRAQCLASDGTIKIDCGWLPGTLVHETLHNHGYHHTPDCAHPEIAGWGDPQTIPYIVGKCVEAVHDYTACRPGDPRAVTCPSGQRAFSSRLLYGVLDPKADNSYTCQCVGIGSPATLPANIEMRTIGGGTISMGTSTTAACRRTNEDLHQVTLTSAFQIMPTEVTQGAFASTMGYNPSRAASCGANCPVESVSWHEAAAYCNALSVERGIRPCYTCTGSGASVSCVPNTQYKGSSLYTCAGYRLPTEAEWEFAYYDFGASTAAFYNSNTVAGCGDVVDSKAGEVAWYSKNNTPYAVLRPVRGKAPNAAGLYDMAGNVVEWVHDSYVNNLGAAAVTNPNPIVTDIFKDYRTMKGGYFSSFPEGMRRAQRYYDSMTRKSSTVGFRCARSPIN